MSAVSEYLKERAFTSEKVRALTHLSSRQLQYWDEQGFVSPSLRRRKGKGRRRLYNFRDLVSLRVAADLRREGISLQLIRNAVEHLRELDYERPLSELRFWPGITTSFSKRRGRCGKRVSQRRRSPRSRSR